MLNKLQEAAKKYDEISYQLTTPEVISDMELYKKCMRDHKNLTPIMEKYRVLEKCIAEIKEAQAILADKPDADLKTLAEEQLYDAKKKAAETEEELKILLLPKDPDDDKNVIVEIRGGAGGEEAALFSAVLYRMYTMYAESVGWKMELIYFNETELGGFKEVSFMIIGDGAYSKLKFESGVHRVQRVPETEASGRIHTSTVTVAVLPEVEEVEVEINPADLQIDTHRASGAGGQHVNKTDSAIRILHIPTGIVVECQDERSQYKNRDKAMKVLRSKLYEAQLREKIDEVASKRKSQVGTGDRSERIRTYNYPQGRVTDHRIGLTLHALENFLNGKIEDMLEALATAERTEMLNNGEF
ncbi:MAG TPA: peptide chain release factor 1 [Clostridiales bacterium]|nr:peptide chain release factor 1 [Clostridiales bacterium]